MAVVDALWLAVLTKGDDDAGSDNRINLTVNNDGIDVVDQDFSFQWITAQGGARDQLEENQAALEHSILPAPFETDGLTNSSIRLGIRGDNAWAPAQVLLIGRTQRAFTPGRIVPLAIETEVADWLSTDSSEGHLTMRLRLAGAGSPATVIRRVLLLVYTDAGNDVQTDSPIQLQISAAGNIVLHRKIGDTPQDDLERRRANWYLLDTDTPFTRQDVASNGAIRLSILGTDAWLPKTVFAFGLDTATGHPNEIVTLVSMPEWGLGWLSTDPQEGSASVELPLSL